MSEHLPRGVIDAHGHLGKWYFPTWQPTAGEVAADMARLGVEAAILSSSLAIIYDAPEGNRELAQAIRPYPQLFGYVSVNLNYLDEALREMEAYLGASARNPQFVGVKVHPLLCKHRYDTPEGLAVTRAAATYGAPILVHTFNSPLESPWNVLPAARAVPEVPIILGHMGGETWWEGIRVAQEAPNIYLEVCSTWTDPEKVRAAIGAVGAGRILFGSDATFFDLSHMLGAMQDAELSPEEWQLIMRENARRLFRIGD